MTNHSIIEVTQEVHHANTMITRHHVVITATKISTRTILDVVLL